MARVWFIVAVLIQMVYANNFDERNCDECIRKGHIWCKELGSEHCPIKANDDWCPTEREELPPLPASESHVAKEKRLYISNPGRVKIPYASPTKLNANVAIVNSTQTKNIVVSIFDTECDGSQCVATIEAIVQPDYCLSTGSVYEHAYAKVTIGTLSEFIIKYHIACACMCSQHVEMDSMKCNGYGNFTCGVCSCRKGWSGEQCEIKDKVDGGVIPNTDKGSSKGTPPNKGTYPPKVPPTCVIQKKSPKCNFKGDYNCGTCVCEPEWTGPNCETQICEAKRGDLQCTNPAKDNVECSGNGYCGPCDTCVCYTDREGSQYFEEEYYCADLCMITNYCDTCLLNNTLGECWDCVNNNNMMTKLAYNETLTQRVDEFNRKVWVKCNETIDDCYIEYWAMKEENEISIMIQKSCNDASYEYVSAGPKVPLIMGILGVIAAVATVVGVLAWKHFTAVPPLPLSDPEYQNIDAEDCTGENPLYKSPMSSFKNPTYGKW
ncbi:integrin beta-6 [Manduca sexta]|uniref:Integrin beta epidermal growth factor-like domain-containing protein n=1 Tax=Manduca sexta TaxID=7130 RepID=A0A921YSN3_MANSE|nr:integrin beta-6 [Manduca sexta]KAG6444038.1 hypothetical protein O3G_MSEX003172 [Manduca sexta]KAG6444039.1 hypothetical protein O3G_MSEX003172 [Manduca sexta]